MAGCRVDFLCEGVGKSVLETNSKLDQLWIYDKNRTVGEITRVRARRYDAVIDFLNNPRSSVLTGLSGAKWRVGFRHGARSVLYNFRGTVPTEPEYVPSR